MTADALSGVLPRRLLLLLLVALFVLAPITQARATEAGPNCEELSEPQVQAAVLRLVAFAQQYRDGEVPSDPAQVEAQLSELFALVDYLIVQSDELNDDEVADLVSQIEALLVSQGVPADQVDAAMAALVDLLNAEQTPTPEEAFNAIFDAVTPYLLQLGFTDDQLDALRAYLLQFLPAHKPCPSPSPSPSPSPTAPATTVPVVNPSPSASPSASPTPAPSSTETRTAGSGLANTGMDDPVLLLGVVAVAMIAGGLALEAGQRRPARRRQPTTHRR